MEFRAITEGIAEVQNIGCSNILIETQSELIRVLMYDLRRRVDIGSVVGRREKAQKILCNRGRRKTCRTGCWDTAG